MVHTLRGAVVLVMSFLINFNHLHSPTHMCRPGLEVISHPGERDRIHYAIKKAKTYGYLPRNFPDVSSPVDALETNLFSSILSNSHHVLCQLLPPEKTTGYNLREHSHNLTLPLIENDMLRKDFLYRLRYVLVARVYELYFIAYCSSFCV